MFKKVDTRKKLPEVEKEILAYWKKNRIFEKTLSQTRSKEKYSFYDGPPFATGTPHYGHIVGSVMKDVVPRYWTMRGYHVERRWGWDCHGLPIENIVEKSMGSKSKKDIEAMGVEKFNAKCRESVLEYVSEWKKIVPRLGRWVDMNDAYRTMDPEFMESVWWAFKSLYDKGLVYEDYRSMHICPRCETTLSQSEVSEEYRDIKDLAVTVKFELIDEPGTFFLAWTTTPWTLPGNTALAVGEDIEYVVVEPQEEKSLFIVAKELVPIVFKEKEYRVKKVFLGKELVGKKYKPPFGFYSADGTLKTIKNKENGWKVYAADFVNTQDGTGIVHIAPAFGTDDMELGKKENLPFVQHVGMDGVFVEELGALARLDVKPRAKNKPEEVREIDITVLKHLKNNSTYFAHEKYLHSYPHCWRCYTPLLNYATSSWFVNVTKLKSELLKNAQAIHWSPEHIKEGRFGNWLEGARDWSISRQRFWASAIPIWKCEACKKERVIGSVMEVSEELGGVNRLYIMRHGEGEHNVMHVLNSLKNKERFGLTGRGHEEARLSGEEVASSGDVDVIIHSPMRRTRETAEIFAKSFPGVECVSDDRLTETDFGVFEGGSEYKLHEKYPRATDRIMTDGTDGVESFRHIRERLESFLADLNTKYRRKTIVLVTHADIARVLYGICRNLSLTETLEGWCPKTGETRSVFSKPVDLHRPYIDNIKLTCQCGQSMCRVPDVLDTWFDSGSMPYAQLHYPFEKKLSFKHRFPADYIGEGIDQTRCWFYYLHVLSTAIQGIHAFKNVIVNGIALAEDGKKMSKNLKNYPDPTLVLDKYGADVLRYYLLSSPVVAAENLSVAESDMAQVQRGWFRMLWNTYSFFVLYANIDGFTPPSSGKDAIRIDSIRSEHILDRWILSRLHTLIGSVNKEMEAYHLNRAVRGIPAFVDDLSNWYVRRSRDRFWKPSQTSQGVQDADKQDAYRTLYGVLVELSKILAPFMSFVSEEIYRNLTGGESVHLEAFPQTDSSFVDTQLEEDMQYVRDLVREGLQKRSEENIKVRQPLASITLGAELDREFTEIVREELNVKKVLFQKDLEKTHIKLDTNITKELKLEGQAREIVRSIQALRKEANFCVDDRIEISFQGMDDMFEAFGEDVIAKETLATSLSSTPIDFPDITKTVTVDGEELTLSLKRVK